MPRKDVEKLISWVRSDKDAYFMKGIRTIGYVLPMAIRTHDRLTAEALLDGLIKAFWYWDARVPKIKDWEALSGSELDRILLERERVRNRRDELRDLLIRTREVAEKLRDKPKGEKVVRGLAKKVVEAIDECERRWELLVSKRMAEGEYEQSWKVSVG